MLSRGKRAWPADGWKMAGRRDGLQGLVSGRIDLSPEALSPPNVELRQEPRPRPIPTARSGVGSSIFSKLLLPGIVFAAFWALAITFWRTSGYLQPLLLFGYIGTALALGLGLYAPAPRPQRAHGPRLPQRTK